MEKFLRIFRSIITAIFLIFAVFGLLYDLDSIIKNLIVCAIALLAALLCINRARHRFAPKSLHGSMPAGASVLALSVAYMMLLGAFYTGGTTANTPVSDVVTATEPPPEHLGMSATELTRVVDSSSAHSGVLNTMPIQISYPDVGKRFVCNTSKPYDASNPFYISWNLHLNSDETISLQDVTSRGNLAREYNVTSLKDNRLVANFDHRLIFSFDFETLTMNLGEKSGERTEEAKCEHYSEKAWDLQTNPYIVSVSCEKYNHVLPPPECIHGITKIRDNLGYRQYAPQEFLGSGLLQDSVFIWRPNGSFVLGLRNSSGSNANLLVTVTDRQASKVIYRGKFSSPSETTLDCTKLKRSCMVY